MKTHGSMNSDSQWKDKVVLVTGGASGMGRDLSLALARAGAKIVIGNRNPALGQAVIDEITQAGGKLSFRSRIYRKRKIVLLWFNALLIPTDVWMQRLTIRVFSVNSVLCMTLLFRISRTP